MEKREIKLAGNKHSWTLAAICHHERTISRREFGRGRATCLATHSEFKIRKPWLLQSVTFPVNQSEGSRRVSIPEKHIKLSNTDADSLLIGTNTAKVMEPWQIISSHGENPYAVQALLGWVINCPLRRGSAKDNSKPLTPLSTGFH